MADFLFEEWMDWFLKKTESCFKMFRIRPSSKCCECNKNKLFKFYNPYINNPYIIVQHSMQVTLYAQKCVDT